MEVKYMTENLRSLLKIKMIKMACCVVGYTERRINTGWRQKSAIGQEAQD